MLNQVAIIGNLATQPKQEILPSGTAKTSFLLAFNDFYIDKSGESQEKTLFFWVECFGRQALNAQSYLVVGHKVAISGSLGGGNIQTTEGYKNCTSIRASSIEYLQKPSSQNNDGTNKTADALVEEDIPF